MRTLRFGRSRASHARAAVVLMISLISGCSERASFGMPDEIVVGTSAAVWTALGPDVKAALETRTFTVRNERIFHITYLPPDDPAWKDLRRMRQVLLIGPSGEPLIAEAMARSGADDSGRTEVLQLHDVWAGNQRVTVALLPDNATPEVLKPLLPKIAELYREQLERSVQLGMTATPANQRLRHALQQAAGFTLDLPYSYQEQGGDTDVRVFRDKEGGLSPVVRTIVVDSRARDAVPWTPEEARAWRTQLARTLNEPPLLTETLSTAHRGTLRDHPIIRIQGVWSSSPGEWPSAGPFIARMVQCPERVFLLDASLYAPADDKFEEMYRLEMILDTFRCTTVA